MQQMCKVRMSKVRMWKLPCNTEKYSCSSNPPAQDAQIYVLDLVKFIFRKFCCPGRQCPQQPTQCHCLQFSKPALWVTPASERAAKHSRAGFLTIIHCKVWYCVFTVIGTKPEVESSAPGATGSHWVTRDMGRGFGWEKVGSGTSLFMQLGVWVKYCWKTPPELGKEHVNQYKDNNSMPWDVLEKDTAFRSNTCCTLTHPGALESWLLHLGFAGKAQIIPQVRQGKRQGKLL